MTRAPLAPTIAAAVLAIGTTAVWVLWGATSTRASQAFISTPQFLLWLLILCAQAAVWVLALGFVLTVTSRRWRDLRASRALSLKSIAEIAASAALLLMLAGTFSFLGGGRGHLFGKVSTRFEHVPHSSEWPLWHHTTKVPVLVGFALFVVVVAMVGTWLIGLSFERLRPSARPDAHDIELFLELRSDLNALLAIAGAIIGLATLSTGALREAVLAANNQPFFRNHPDGKLEFDAAYVLAYGFFFSLLLAIAFAPSFVSMRRAGSRMRDCAYPLRAPTDASFADVNSSRKALDELLQINLSATTTFKAGAAILTPLAGSLVALLLPN